MTNVIYNDTQRILSIVYIILSSLFQNGSFLDQW